jgi:hypothetical protein
MNASPSAEPSWALLPHGLLVFQRKTRRGAPGAHAERERVLASSPAV